jgi:two-component system nitrogen regulation response regulator GlnG
LYIVATNRSPEKLITEGNLRKDFFYRIEGRRIELPALRDRAEDIPALARHFLGADAGALTSDARTLQAYHWPGNVRQFMRVLVNARETVAWRGERWIRSEDIESSIWKADEARDKAERVEAPDVHPDCLRPKTAFPLGRSAPEDGFYVRGTLEQIKHQVILKTFRQVQGNQSEAARRLGVSRRTICTWVYQFGDLHPKEEAGHVEQGLV